MYLHRCLGYTHTFFSCSCWLHFFINLFRHGGPLAFHFAHTGVNSQKQWMFTSGEWRFMWKYMQKDLKKLLGQISGSGFDKWTPEGKNSNTNYRTVTIAWQNDDNNPRQWWKQPTDTEHLCSDDRIIECRRFINR